MAQTPPARIGGDVAAIALARGDQARSNPLSIDCEYPALNTPDAAVSSEPGVTACHTFKENRT